MNTGFGDNAGRAIFRSPQQAAQPVAACCPATPRHRAVLPPDAGARPCSSAPTRWPRVTARAPGGDQYADRHAQPGVLPYARPGSLGVRRPRAAGAPGVGAQRPCPARAAPRREQPGFGARCWTGRRRWRRRAFPVWAWREGGRGHQRHGGHADRRAGLARCLPPAGCRRDRAGAFGRGVVRLPRRLLPHLHTVRGHEDRRGLPASSTGCWKAARWRAATVTLTSTHRRPPQTPTACALPRRCSARCSIRCAMSRCADARDQRRHRQPAHLPRRGGRRTCHVQKRSPAATHGAPVGTRWIS